MSDKPAPIILVQHERFPPLSVAILRLFKWLAAKLLLAIKLFTVPDFYSKGIKALMAGAVGGVIGWIVQIFLTSGLGIPYYISYVLALLAGFVGTYTSNILNGNIVLKARTPKGASLISENKNSLNHSRNPKRDTEPSDKEREPAGVA